MDLSGPGIDVKLKERKKEKKRKKEICSSSGGAQEKGKTG